MASNVENVQEDTKTIMQTCGKRSWKDKTTTATSYLRHLKHLPKGKFKFFQRFSIRIVQSDLRKGKNLLEFWG